MFCYVLLCFCYVFNSLAFLNCPARTPPRLDSSSNALCVVPTDTAVSTVGVHIGAHPITKFVRNWGMYGFCIAFYRFV